MNPFKLLKNKFLRPCSYTGPFGNWQKAINASRYQYESQEFFTKQLHAARGVRDGKYIYERDTVPFTTIQYSWPFLCCFLFISQRESGILNVLDFGGGLGSTFNQVKRFSSQINLSWNIVEQEKLVQFGRAEFQTPNLRFYSSIQACLSKQKINLVVFSSVLQYLEDPFAFIEEIENSSVNYILIDRLVLSKSGYKIMIQKVPSNIYHAEIPCHFFDEKDFKKKMSENFLLFEEWILSEETTDLKIEKGMFWIRK